MLKLKKGDIWIVELQDIEGHEQEGKRPAVIIVDIRSSDIAVVIPMTKTIERERFPYTQTIMPSKENGLNYEGVALIYQIRALSKEKRFIRRLGKLSQEDIRLVDAQIKSMLRLE